MKTINRLFFVLSLFVLMCCSHKPEAVPMTQEQYDLLEIAHQNLYQAFLKQQDAMTCQEYYFKSIINHYGNDSIHKFWMERNQELADSFFDNDFYYRGQNVETRIHPEK